MWPKGGYFNWSATDPPASMLTPLTAKEATMRAVAGIVAVAALAAVAAGCASDPYYARSGYHSSPSYAYSPGYVYSSPGYYRTTRTTTYNYSYPSNRQAYD